RLRLKAPCERARHRGHHSSLQQPGDDLPCDRAAVRPSGTGALIATDYMAPLRGLVGAATCALVGLSVTPTVQAQGADATLIAISQEAGDIYLVRSGPDATVFLANDSGIVLIDPL